MEAEFRCIGGVDNDAAAIADFGRAASTPGTVLDMFSREQFEAFHCREPSADWQEATPEDIRRAAGGERPHRFPVRTLQGVLWSALPNPQYHAQV